VAFPLHPETPAEGRTLEDLFAGVPMDLAAMKKRLAAVAESLGLPYGNRSRTYNSRLAQELGKWAESEGAGNRFHDAAFRAYFAEGLNLADIEVLVNLARSVGLSGQRARQAVEQREFKAAVDRDWQLSMDLGVRAVPTLAVGNRTLVGAQPYEAMQAFLFESGLKLRKLD
jgi:predicted DsbA family dithiol-disulfide isomerase